MGCSGPRSSAWARWSRGSRSFARDAWSTSWPRPGGGTAQYAEKVAAITAAYNEALVARQAPIVVPLLVAHFMVSGVRVSHSERELHIGDAYSATAQAIPAGPQYVALGHIHAPQPVPGAAVPAEYAGSLLALDFGEAGEAKRVVLVDVEPGSLATVRSVPITAGRPLVAARGTWDELAARAAELADSYVDLTVAVRRARPRARPSRGRSVPVPGSGARGAAGRRAHGNATTRRSAPPTWSCTRRSCARSPVRNRPADLVALLREVLEEAADAPA